MIVKRFAGLLLIHIGVTIDTAVGAGVISPDVRTCRTAAFFSCRFIFVPEAIRKEQALNNAAIYTMGLFDAIVY